MTAGVLWSELNFSIRSSRSLVTSSHLRGTGGPRVQDVDGTHKDVVLDQVLKGAVADLHRFYLSSKNKEQSETNKLSEIRSCSCCRPRRLFVVVCLLLFVCLLLLLLSGRGRVRRWTEADRNRTGERQPED